MLPALYAAASPEARGGTYYGPSGRAEMTRGVAPAKVPARALDDGDAAGLWEVSERLAKVAYPTS